MPWEKDFLVCLNSWRAFQCKCGREELMSELYMKQPAAEYLSNAKPGKIKFEYPHPQIPRKSIDYVIISRDNEYIKHAFEAKFLRNRNSNAISANRASYLYDLLKLEAINSRPGQPRRHMVLFAEKNQFIQFINLSYTDSQNRSYKSWSQRYFPVSIGSLVNVDCQGCPSELQNEFADYENKYGMPVPRSFSVRLSAIVSREGFTFAMWEVSRSQNRRTFSPRLLGWH